MAKLNTYVHAVERDDKGNTMNSAVFGPDDTLPAWAVKAITNPDVWDGKPPAHVEARPESGAGAGEPSGDGASTSGDPSVEPPKSGKGSGVEAWRAHAAHLGVTVADDASRDDIIAAVEAHNAA